MGEQPAILLRDIDKSFGDKQVLRGFSATLPVGGATALMGPSGSGKTTLSRIIMGLERPDAGVVEGTQRLRLCPVFQEDRLCEGLTAVDNVALVLPRQRQGEVCGALAGVGLTGAEWGKPVSCLSGGERRRVELVRAVLAEGDMLVLDEAFKGLDTDTRALAFGFIRANLRGRGLLLITHAAAEAEALGTGIIRIEPVAAAAAG